MKLIRRLIALIALVAVAIRGILSFLTWFEKQEEIDWTDDEDLEEAI
jgi:multidrug resistance efflux pump